MQWEKEHDYILHSNVFAVSVVRDKLCTSFWTVQWDKRIWFYSTCGVLVVSVLGDKLCTCFEQCSGRKEYDYILHSDILVVSVIRDKLCTSFEQCSGRKNTRDRYADHSLQRAGIEWKAFLCWRTFCTKKIVAFIFSKRLWKNVQSSYVSIGRVSIKVNMGIIFYFN